MNTAVFEIILILAIAAALFTPPAPDVSDEPEAVTEVATVQDPVAALDAVFAASHPEPDGSTASMRAYAEAYRDFWQAEVDRLVAADPDLAAEYAVFEATLSQELEAYAETFRDGDGAPYGTAVAYEVPYRHAERLREFAEKWLGDSRAKERGVGGNLRNGA